MFNGFKPFEGNGSYLVGIQAGFNHLFPSRLLVGIETDMTAPSLLGGGQVVSTPLGGQALYQEQVQFSGTLRGRVGYAPGGWLFYGTGGLAWSYDQFSRTQMTGSAGTLNPGDVENRTKVARVGFAAGAGVEAALPVKGWSARLEYLYTGFGSRNVNFPLSAQQFETRLDVQSVRLGLNYQVGRDSIDPKIFLNGPGGLDLDRFSFHGQTTYLQQYAAPFRQPYHGANSLDSNSGRQTWDLTLFIGAKLWEGAELWLNPEIDQGFGLSGTLGVAGFTSGAAFKVGSETPYGRLQRAFIRQTIDLSGEKQKVEADVNQFAGSQTENRLVLTVGKFSVSDVFDTNKYAQNPRRDFMNWSLIDAASLDYAADAWGYSYGAAAEWYQGPWTLRLGVMDGSVVPNSTELDPHFSQFQWLAEIEHRYELLGHPGKIAVTGFLTRARLGRFDEAIQLALQNGGPANAALVRRFTSSGGVVFNLEQQLAPDLGFFMRGGWANGKVESYDYTDVDRSIAAGLSLAGQRWGRPNDTVGFAGMVNAISSAHQAFLNAGGLGILVGDGMLPNPGLEKIIETYYSFPVFGWHMTFDYQFIVNPGYNRDRGPVSVFGSRARLQF